MTSRIPVVSAPMVWTQAMAEWTMPDAEAVSAAYFDSAHPLHRLAVDSSADGVAEFADQLGRGLAGPSRSVIVTYPAGSSPTVAAALVGEVLGGVQHTAKLPLVGPIEVNADSSGTRSNSNRQIEYAAGKRPDYHGMSPWHTDCSPWRVPARWTVLGANSCDPIYADAPTEVVPLHRLLDAWSEDPALLAVLRETEVDWRQIFDGIGRLLAPVLEPSKVRWLSIALADVLSDPDSLLGKACIAFDNQLDSFEDPFLAYISEGLLVIDNHQVLHRGPVIEHGHLRRILKIKIGGLPEN
jgi:hypothetical protein